MPIKVITGGDPGLAKMASLQEIIRRNVNARTTIASDDARGLRRATGGVLGVIGGAPPVRGTGTGGGLPVPPPSIIPFPPLPTKPGLLGGLPGVSQSVLNPEPPTKPGLLGGLPGVSQSVLNPEPPLPPGGPIRQDLTSGGGMPIFMSQEAILNSVTGSQSGPYRGPAICYGWAFDTFGAEAGGIQWNLFRVDFTENPGLQTFAFNDSGLPTGGVSEGVSLFGLGSIEDTTDLNGTVLTQGWCRLLGTVNSFVQLGPRFTRLVIPYERFFIKLYSQNDSAGDRFPNLWLDCGRITGNLGVLPGTVTTREGYLGVVR